MDIQHIVRPKKQHGFIKRGDFISLHDGETHSVFMRINEDGTSEDPADYPDKYFRLAQYTESETDALAR